MQFSIPGTVLSKDLYGADGRLVASRGEVVDFAQLKRVASLAPQGLRERPLCDTSLGDALLETLCSEPLQHFVGDQLHRAQVANILAEVSFPQAIWDEVESLRADDPQRFQHALWTAVVTARLFHAGLGSAPGLSRLVGGAITHDIGMRLSGPRLRNKREHLTRAEAIALEDHPMMGALLLASVLGDAPAVHFALLHHTRAGYGYPRVSRLPPLRGLDLLAVASAYAALVAPRPFRERAFNPRGAVDQLCEEAAAGHFDPRAVKLLVGCMRGGQTPIERLSLPREKTGYRPAANNHGVLQSVRLAG